MVCAGAPAGPPARLLFVIATRREIDMGLFHEALCSTYWAILTAALLSAPAVSLAEARNGDDGCNPVAARRRLQADQRTAR
jgi:hypothetical protein